MATREYVLGRLQRELRAAEDVHADAFAAELRTQIARLSAGTTVSPARETTARTAGTRRKTDGRASGIRQR